MASVMWINLNDVLAVVAIFGVFFVPMYALARWSGRPTDGRSWDDVGGPITPKKRP